MIAWVVAKGATVADLAAAAQTPTGPLWLGIGIVLLVIGILALLERSGRKPR